MFLYDLGPLALVRIIRTAGGFAVEIAGGAMCPRSAIPAQKAILTIPADLHRIIRQGPEFVHGFPADNFCQIMGADVSCYLVSRKDTRYHIAGAGHRRFSMPAAIPDTVSLQSRAAD